MEETGRVHAIGDGAADEREPVEDHGGLVGVLEEDLLEDIERDDEDQKGGDRHANLRPEAELREALGQRSRDLLEDTHRCRGSVKRSCECREETCRRAKQTCRRQQGLFYREEGDGGLNLN